MHAFDPALRRIMTEDMESIATKVATLALEASPKARQLYKVEDVAQMIRGMAPLYLEALDGSDAGARYVIDMMIPGLIARGSTLFDIIHEGYRAHMNMQHGVCERLPQDQRLAAGVWMADVAVGIVWRFHEAANEVLAKQGGKQ